jgi:hypothetical protein
MVTDSPRDGKGLGSLRKRNTNAQYFQGKDFGRGSTYFERKASL